MINYTFPPSTTRAAEVPTPGYHLKTQDRKSLMLLKGQETKPDWVAS